MSANIMWQPTGKGRDAKVQAPSMFLDGMGKVFGNPPWVLGEEHLKQLHAMDAISSMGGFGEIVSLIEANGEIRVWAEY